LRSQSKNTSDIDRSTSPFRVSGHEREEEEGANGNEKAQACVAT